MPCRGGRVRAAALCGPVAKSGPVAVGLERVGCVDTLQGAGRLVGELAQANEEMLAPQFELGGFGAGGSRGPEPGHNRRVGRHGSAGRTCLLQRGAFEIGAFYQTDPRPAAQGRLFPRQPGCDFPKVIRQARDCQPRFVEDKMQPPQADGRVESILAVVVLGLDGSQQRGDDLGQARRRCGRGGRGPLGTIGSNVRFGARCERKACGRRQCMWWASWGEGWLTGSVRRMLLDLPAQLRNVFPAAGASRLVQLLYVAQRLLVLGRLLRCCKLPTRP